VCCRGYGSSWENQDGIKTYLARPKASKIRFKIKEYIKINPGEILCENLKLAL